MKDWLYFYIKHVLQIGVPFKKYKGYGVYKGYLRPELKQYSKQLGIDLQTPLRKNMKDHRSKEAMGLLMKARRKIETVIGQLTDRFHI